MRKITDGHEVRLVVRIEVKQGGDMSEIGDRVMKVIVEHLGVYPDKVTPQASFIDDLGIDSLDVVELVMALEDEFGVEIPDDEAEKIRTVQDAISYIGSAKG